MNTGRRAAAALFQSVSARSTGFRVARLDEQSLSPADRAATMLLMLIGGGIGGTAGGLRIVIVAILLGTLLRGRKDSGLSSEGGQDARPPMDGQDARPPGHEQEGRALAVQVAAAVATAMLLLIAFAALALIYREPAAFDACVFEAVSACCNVGFTTGMTRSLQPESQVIVILTMLLGRILPLALLANYLRRPVAPSSEKQSSLSDQQQPTQKADR
jgi:trk system potassium uptake protein TrkH